MFARVRRAFAAGVVAADVDGEIVRILVEAAEEFEVVRRGGPGGFLELTSGDVVYFDPALGRKLIGKKPSESTTARSGAKSGSTRTG